MAFCIDPGRKPMEDHALFCKIGGLIERQFGQQLGRSTVQL